MDVREVYRKGTEEGGERARRGLRLFRERGGEIVLYPVTGEFGVPSESEEGVLYVVSLERGTCSCEDRPPKGEFCKHRIAARLKLGARRRLAKARRGTLLERFRHGDMDPEQRLELAHELGVRA